MINGLLASTLWYNATSIPIPTWAILQIEQSLYDFFWSYKRHLTTKDILALPLKEGGFDIPRLQTKIRSLRLNTLRSLLSKEEAHWKYFTSYFLRISNMRLGTMSLALNYSLQRIDRDIPSFHEELLTAWHRQKDLHMRTESPDSIIDILNEPLFLNPAITTADKPLIFTDWVAAGITRIGDICYEVIPGFLPVSAIHDILTEDTARNVSRTTEEWKELLVALPSQWCKKILLGLSPAATYFATLF